MIQLATLAVALATAAAPVPTAPPSFSRDFTLLLVSDSVWGHCDMSITVSDGSGVLGNVCRTYDGPLTRKGRPLKAGEIAELRSLLRSADLFGHFAEGRDGRGLDLPLITLRVETVGRTVEVVCFENSDFEKDGPRKRLLDRLLSWFRETHT